MTASCNTLETPPLFSFVAGRKLSSTLTSYISYNPGVWKLGNWGPSEEFIGNSSCMIGFLSQSDRRQWTTEIQAGLRESHITIAHSRPLVASVNGKIEITLSTSSGIKAALVGDKKVDTNTVLGVGVEAGAVHGITLNLRFSRLGQKFSLPVFLSNELNLRVLALSLLGPLLTGIALDQLVFSKWREIKRLE